MTKEILHAAISISDPRQRWMMSRQPALNPAFALADVVWIMNGRRDIGFLEFWNTIPILGRWFCKYGTLKSTCLNPMENRSIKIFHAM